MNSLMFVLIILNGGGFTSTTTVVGHYPEAVCYAMAQRHNRFAINRYSTAYCNPEKPAE